MGTHFHGLLDDESFRNGLLDYLFDQRGLSRNLKSIPAREEEYDRLADHVAKHLDMKLIEDIIEKQKKAGL